MYSTLLWRNLICLRPDKEHNVIDNRITQFISAAEKHIESQHYSLALEQLAAAEQIEPDNKSIKMIRDLVRSLQADYPNRTQSSRFLSVTIDPKSATGIKQDTGGAPDVQRRIKSLTSSAQYFLTRGAVDNAFESLMRAYLLNPVAPEVLACEKSVLPAWQTLHGSSPADAKREWKPDLIPHTANTPSSLFERLKSGKLFR